MKPGHFLFILILFIAGPSFASATDTNEGDWALRWNPVPLPLRALALEGDIALGEHWSIGPLVAWSAKWVKNNASLQAKALGLRLNWWFTGERLHTGFLLSLFGEGISLNLKEPIGGVELEGTAGVGHVGLLAAFHCGSSVGLPCRWAVG